MSGSIFLSNLDDYILPSQACVNPLVSAKIATASSSVVNVQSIQLSFENADALKQPVERSVAAVTLNDCLACSGCITSAETMLIQEQSVEKFEEILKECTFDIVVLISPNSMASIADLVGIPPTILFLKIATLFKSIGVKHVLDATCGGDIALIESREEFLMRYKQGRRSSWIAPMTTTAYSSSAIYKYENPMDVNNPTSLPSIPSLSQEGAPSLATQLPMLASHCPGWVCYAEKTQPFVIPYMSTVKSSQQIIGSLLKSSQTIQLFESIDAIKRKKFIVSIQPCFDKKLEASRKDFYHELIQDSEVDLVICTNEFWDFVLQRMKLHQMQPPSLLDDHHAMQLDHHPVDGMDDVQLFHSIQNQIPLDPQRGTSSLESFFRTYSSNGFQVTYAVGANAGSGGYAEYIFKYAAQTLFGIDIWNHCLVYKESPRNPDFAYIDLKDVIDQLSDNVSIKDIKQDEIHLKFARAYGFRNIQSVIRKLKKGDCEFDYIEVMACPSGCNNGGGQLKPLLSTTSGISSLPRYPSHGKNEEEGLDSTSPLPTLTVNPPSKQETNDINVQQNRTLQTLRKELPSETKERIKRIESLFHSSIESTRQPHETPLSNAVYSTLVPLGETARSLFHTRYHAVPKLEVIAPLATKW